MSERGTPEALIFAGAAPIVRWAGTGWPSGRTRAGRAAADLFCVFRLPVAIAVAVVVAVVVALVVVRHAEEAAPGEGGPPAASNLRCATASHPYPVVLVPGTFDGTSWTAIRRALRARGYCAYAFDYGDDGVGSIVVAARNLGRRVDQVLAHTHATRVSIVGHSQGGLVGRYYVRFLAGAAKVRSLVALAPPNHGTTTPLVIPGALLGCVACAQQAAGSDFIDRLNAGDGIPPPVAYTVIETRYDLVVTPYQSAFLRGPPGRTTNVLLQDGCPGDLAGHLSITSDPAAVQWVAQALARNGPADPAFRPRC
jgi:triacylglycerol lipase